MLAQTRNTNKSSSFLLWSDCRAVPYIRSSSIATRACGFDPIPRSGSPFELSAHKFREACRNGLDFDIQIGSEPRSIDEEGEHFSDFKTARAEAGLALCGLARDMMENGNTVSDIAIWVRDELGEVMHANASGAAQSIKSSR